MYSQLLCACIYLLMICSSTAKLQGEIVETNDISSVLSAVDKDTLVLFNITDTLYAPTNTFGSHQWRSYFAERAEKVISNTELKQWLINWIKCESIAIPKKPVEECTPDLIENLQLQSIAVLGITKKTLSTPYADNFGEITRDHLLSIGIDLEKTLSYYPVTVDQQSSKYAFAYGILFASKQPIGQTLLSFLSGVKSRPRKIVMVDNSRRSLEDVDTALTSSGITFKGYRYGRCDARKKAFDPTIGIIQLLKYELESKILSDEEALKEKLAHPQINYDACLDEFLAFIDCAYSSFFQ